jgi:hypothetical protein
MASGVLFEKRRPLQKREGHSSQHECAVARLCVSEVFMKGTRLWLCLTILITLCPAFAQQAKPSFSQMDALWVPGETSIRPVYAVVNPNTIPCTNCLIKRCALTAGKLNGYCLEGARGGICHEAYDPTHCPAGKLPNAPIRRQCGVSTFTIDNLRACQ